MNIQKNERVRRALYEYFELYDYPSRKKVASRIGLNYYRFNSFLNNNANYADKSLQQIIKYLHKVEERNKQLKEIINSI